MKKTEKSDKPTQTNVKKKKRVQDHPFFGSDKDTRPVEEVIRELRRCRYEWKNGTVVRVEKDLKPRL
jgi:hypothetical protein